MKLLSISFLNAISITCLGLLLCVNFACEGQNKKISINGDSLARVYQIKFDKYIKKTEGIAEQVVIDQTGIHLNPSKPEGDSSRVDLSWEEALRFQSAIRKNPQSAFERFGHQQDSWAREEAGDTLSPIWEPISDDLPLQGLKIALDPGHMAGDMNMARFEGKFVNLKHPNGKTLQFYESFLAWYTSRILADTLERLGAQVILTRDDYDLTSLDITYDEWYRHYQDTLSQGAPLGRRPAFYKTFKKIEFIARVDKINLFQPDLTLILHFNVDASNQPWKRPTNKNNSMAFVGGSFVDGELEKPEARFNLLRLLLGDDLESSIEFSDYMLKALEKELGIPPLPQENDQFFIPKYCLPTEAPGVYCRNLTLARRAFGVLCYLEPLYQDNIQESQMLALKDDDYKGQAIPSRIREVAYAYLRGILDYLQE